MLPYDQNEFSAEDVVCSRESYIEALTCVLVSSYLLTVPVYDEEGTPAEV